MYSILGCVLPLQEALRQSFNFLSPLLSLSIPYEPLSHHCGILSSSLFLKWSRLGSGRSYSFLLTCLWPLPFLVLMGGGKEEACGKGGLEGGRRSVDGAVGVTYQQHSIIIIIVIIIITIIIIAFKRTIRDFLQSPHSAANCLQHVRSSGPGAIVCKTRATHRALITCKCHVTCHLVRMDSSAIKFDRVEIAFIWALFYWLNH